MRPKMKKMPASTTEPALNDYSNNHNIHTPKLYKNPLNKFAYYEGLINEYIAANPNYSEYELDRACLYFANQCGLTIAEKAKEKRGGRHVY